MQYLKYNTSQTFGTTFRRLAKSGALLAVLVSCVLTMASVNAQKPPRIPTPKRQFCLQDDKTGQFLTFTDRGNYAFTDCPGGATIEGVGRTEFLGCTTTFVADNGTRLVKAEIDQCGGEGKAFIQIQDDCPNDVDCQGKQFLISDSTLKDSDCGACR
jgi:hypothetical protein